MKTRDEKPVTVKGGGIAHPFHAAASAAAEHAPDLRAFLDAWPYAAGHEARFAQAADGRRVILVRRKMGLEQYETTGRPDGRRPHGADSAMHYQMGRLTAAGTALKLSSADCADLFDEAAIYRSRLEHLLRLGAWERAASDSAHNLCLFDLVSRHAEHVEDRVELEVWRPETIRMNVVARALSLLDRGQDAEALALTGAGIDSLDGGDELPALRHTLMRMLSDCLATAPQDRASGGSRFVRQGDFWSVCYQGRACFFKTTRGLSMLAVLLRYPGREFHASELLGHAIGAPAEARLPHARPAEPLLDARAKSECQRQLAALRCERDAAERRNDPGALAQACEEIEGIVAQLASALGLGARDRQPASPEERARSSVTKRIKQSIAHLGDELPPLGRHLAARIRTGYFCSYNPHPDRPVAWKF